MSSLKRVTFFLLLAIAYVTVRGSDVMAASTVGDAAWERQPWPEVTPAVQVHEFDGDSAIVLRGVIDKLAASGVPFILRGADVDDDSQSTPLQQILEENLTFATERALYRMNAPVKVKASGNGEFVNHAATHSVRRMSVTALIDRCFDHSYEAIKGPEATPPGSSGGGDGDAPADADDADGSGAEDEPFLFYNGTWQPNSSEYWRVGDVAGVTMVHDVPVSDLDKSRPEMKTRLRSAPAAGLTVSCAGVVTRTRIDDRDILAYQVSGRTRVALAPPQQAHAFYLHPLHSDAARQSQVPVTAPVNAALFPHFARLIDDVSAAVDDAEVELDATESNDVPQTKVPLLMQADVRAGDILYIPSRWLRSTTAATASTSLSFYSSDTYTRTVVEINNAVDFSKAPFVGSERRVAAAWLIATLSSMLRSLPATPSSSDDDDSDAGATSSLRGLLHERYAATVALPAFTAAALPAASRAFLPNGCARTELPSDMNAPLRQLANSIKNIGMGTDKASQQMRRTTVASSGAFRMEIHNMIERTAERALRVGEGDDAAPVKVCDSEHATRELDEAFDDDVVHDVSCVAWFLHAVASECNASV
jgi:hypothetical protein